MPCLVCGLWPTWADLSECANANCPWELDYRLPIPPLPKVLRDAPLHQPFSAPPIVQAQPIVRGPLSAVVDLSSAPMHSYASMHPPAAQDVSSAASSLPVSFAAAIASTAAPKAPAAPIAPFKTTAAAPTKALPGAGLRFSCRQVQDDYDLIMGAVKRMNWSGTHGPTCRVDTQLTWKNGLCRELYTAIKLDLHDVAFMQGKQQLYFYVGALGNWGKGGFRISGHSKPAANIGSSQTHGVLHIDK